MTKLALLYPQTNLESYVSRQKRRHNPQKLDNRVKELFKEFGRLSWYMDKLSLKVSMDKNQCNCYTRVAEIVRAICKVFLFRQF